MIRLILILILCCFVGCNKLAKHVASDLKTECEKNTSDMSAFTDDDRCVSYWLRKIAEKDKQ